MFRYGANLPHTIVVKLHVHQVSVVIFTPEVAGPVGVLLSIQDEVMNFCRSALPCGRNLLAPLTGNKEGSKEHGTPSKTYLRSVTNQQIAQPCIVCQIYGAHREGCSVGI